MGDVVGWVERARNAWLTLYGAWPSIFKITFKMVHSEGVLTYSLGNREASNAQLQDSNM